MRVYLSADIEGVTTTHSWPECDPGSAAYRQHADQMTREVVAICEAAREVGVSEITVRDAHDAGLNIDPTALPEYVTLLRGWSGHPYSMVEGINDTYDAAMFVGYHSAASRPGNPLAHTMTGRCSLLRINGRVVSEFYLHSLACAREGVPTVFLAGDAQLCQDEAELHPSLVTVPVKDAMGGLTVHPSTAHTDRALREGVRRALSQDLRAARIELPQHFDMTVNYRDTALAEKASYFPGVRRVDPLTVGYESDDYFEVLRTVQWILM